MARKGVVLSGYYGFANAGDEAVCAALCQALKPLSVTVLSNRPRQTAQRFKVKAKNRWRFREVFQALRKAECLVSGGGSLLQDATSRHGLYYYLGVILLARMLRTPVAVYAQGVGPLYRWENKRLVAFVLNRTQYISVRDQQSRDLLVSIGVKKPIHVVPDPVMGIAPEDALASSAKGKALLEKAGVDLSKPVVVASLRPWSERDTVRLFAQALDQVAAAGASVVLVPMQDGVDTAFAKAVCGHMIEEATLVETGGVLEHLFALFAAADLVLGMRLHALIMATAQGSRTVALSYDPKVDAFARTMDQPCLKVKTLDVETLVGEIKKALVGDAPSEEKRAFMRKAASLPAVWIKNHCKEVRSS